MDKKKMLEDLIAYYSRGNKTKFAETLGLTSSGLGNWLRRGVFDAEKIYTHCAGVNPSWLLTGEGDMIKASAGDPEDKSDFAEATLRGHLNLSQAVRDLAEANRRLTEEINELKHKH